MLLPLMRENVVLNGLSGMVDIEELSWGGELPAYAMGEVGLLLLADCVYFEPGACRSLTLLAAADTRKAFPLLVDTMKRLISEKTLCLFCYKKRRKVRSPCHCPLAS